MSKSEERYLEHFQDGRLRNCSSKEAFLLGYHQAEKDLELTWKDIHAIAIIEDKLIHELCLNDQELPNTQEFYEEVLKRFKTKKEESC